METWCNSISVIMYAVHDYNGSGVDYVAWGDCDGEAFCCAHDEQTVLPVNDVKIYGTIMGDEIYLHSLLGDMAPAKAHRLDAFVYGNSNGGEIAEYIRGSDNTGGEYRDNLYGEGGNDTIDGGEDADWISGGDGADTLRAGAGNDRVVGDEGNDFLAGEQGNDTLCDAGGSIAGHEYQGGFGNDTLWYVKVGASSLSGASNAGAGTNQCGDWDDWGNQPWNNCSLGQDIDTVPPECTDPN